MLDMSDALHYDFDRLGRGFTDISSYHSQRSNIASNGIHS